MIGTDKVAIPNKNFTEDQWNEFYDKVGRPETPINIIYLSNLITFLPMKDK